MVKQVLFCLSISCLSCILTLTTSVVRAEDKITFDDHIKPIFREHCLTCHNANEKKSDLALDTFAATMAGGSGGEIVSAGDLDSSRLWELVAHVAQPYMPPQQDKLSDAKLALIKAWIEQGMPENSGSVIKKKNSAASSMLASSSSGKPDGPPPMPEKLLKQPAIYTPRSAAIAALAASPWAPLVAVGGQLQVSLYNTETGDLLGVIPFPEGEPQSLTFTRDGRQLLIGGGRHGSSGCAILVDIASGERITKVGEELDTVLAADISPDKRRIALAGPQKLIRIYDSATGELVHEMKKHTDWVYALRYSPDGVLLASSDRSNGLIVWEADTGQLYADLVGHKGEIRGLDFRPDSNVLASASLDGTVKLWGMQDSNLQKSFDAHSGGATSVAFTQDGSIATAGRDSKVRLWSVDGTKKADFEGLAEAALEVAITGNGAQIVGGDWNGKVQMWQAADPKVTRTLAANPPTLAQALEQSKTAASAVQVLFDAAAKSATELTTQFKAVKTQMAEAESGLKTSIEQLVVVKQKQETLTKSLAAQKALVAELEAKLAEAKKAQAATDGELVASLAQVKVATVAANAAKTRQAEVKAKHDELAKASEAAAAKLAEIDAQHKAAQTNVAKAEADLATFAKRAEELKVEAEKIAAVTALTEKQVAEKARLEAAKDAEAKRLADEMQKLQAELIALQQKVAAASTAQTTAQSELTATQAAASELKAALEKAQQDAAQATERLKLFQESYK